MNTALLLMTQFGGKAIITIDWVRRDYSSHLTPTKLIRKISAGGASSYREGEAAGASIRIKVLQDVIQALKESERASKVASK